ncbi:Epoxide hydrolase [Balamuthia mandrillaris]
MLKSFRRYGGGGHRLHHFFHFFFALLLLFISASSSHTALATNIADPVLTTAPHLLQEHDTLSSAVPLNQPRPFQLYVPDVVLQDLDHRLSLARFPDQQPAVDKNEDEWSQGVPLSYMLDLVRYWRDGFDWRRQEAALNEMTQYKVLLEVEGERFDVHFVHVRSKREDATPLMVVHGWPGSFMECSKILPFLVDPESHGGKTEDAFHVVCPSLPGYTLSSIPTKRGCNQLKAAKIFAKLMEVLNYDSYVVQGGDWGAIVATLMASSYVAEAHVRALHINFVTAPLPIRKGIWGLLKTIATFAVPSWILAPEEIEPFQNQFMFTLKESGYMHEQATRPQTLGYALNDSPVGLAAWIVEKFYVWSDCNGNIESRFTKDELLTNVMLYWTSQTITSSMRFYYEYFHAPPSVDNSTETLQGPPNQNMMELLQSLYIRVPTGCAIFPTELVATPKWIAEYTYNVQRWTRMSKGGHFAALEEPALLAEDLRAFCGQHCRKQTEEPLNDNAKPSDEL